MSDEASALSTVKKEKTQVCGIQFSHGDQDTDVTLSAGNTGVLVMSKMILKL